MLSFQKFIVQKLDRLFLLGVKEEDDCLLVERIKSTNKSALFCFIIGVASSLSTLFFIQSPFIYIPIVFSFSYLLTIWISYLGFHEVASLSPWWISLIIFFWLAGAYGKESNAYLLFIVAEIVAIFNVDMRKTKLVFVMLSAPPILVVICYLTNFSLFNLGIPAEDLSALSPVFFFTVIISAAISLYTYAKNMQSHLEKLQEKFIELAKANEELDRFVYSVSHDLSAPISSVKGLVDLCSTDKPNLDTYLELQRKSVKRLDNFIKDILHYARNSRLEITSAPVNLNEVIKEIFEEQMEVEAADNVQLNVNIKGESIFFTDEFRLNIIISNIISNAIRYRRKDTAQSFIHFDVFLSENEVRIEAEDNGIGIKAEYLPKIFQMFYRANIKSVGSGLGLYLVKETIKKLKGRIEAQSTDGKGSVFMLNIPNLKEKDSPKYAFGIEGTPL